MDEPLSGQPGHQIHALTIYMAWILQFPDLQIIILKMDTAKLQYLSTILLTIVHNNVQLQRNASRSGLQDSGTLLGRDEIRVLSVILASHK